MNACSHAGLVDEVENMYQDVLDNKYVVFDLQSLFRLVVDAYARAGKLEKAEQFINKMTKPNILTFLDMSPSFFYCL